MAAKKMKRGTVTTRALEARIRQLESQVEILEHDNEAAREGWQRVYSKVFPQACDGPHLGMHISGSIETILRGIESCRYAAGVVNGKNCGQR